MPDLVTLLMHGGPFAYLTLIAAILATLNPVVCGIITALRFRVPAGLWFLGPALVVSVGTLGTILGVQMAADAVGHASPETQTTLAAAGHSVALYTSILGWALAAGLLGWTAFLAAASTVIGGGKTGRWHPIAAVGAGIVGGLAAVVVVPIALWKGLGTMGILVGPVALGAGLSLALVALRSGEEEDDEANHRLGAARGVVGAASLGAVVAMGFALYFAGQVEIYSPIAYASAETKLMLLSRGLDAAFWGPLLAGVVAVLMVLSGAIATLPVLRSAVDLRGVIGGLFAAVVSLPVVLLLVAQVWVTRPLVAVATGKWLVTDFAEYVIDLPRVEDASGMLLDVAEPPSGQCMVWLGMTGWTARRSPAWASENAYWGASDPADAGADCPEVEGPLVTPLDGRQDVVVAASGSLPARTVTSIQWFPVDGRVTVVTAGPLAHSDMLPDLFDALRYEGLALQWATPAITPEDVRLIARIEVVDTSTGTAWFLDGVPMPGGLEAVFAKDPYAGANGLTLVAGESWTLQQLISICATTKTAARGVDSWSVDCRVSPEGAGEWEARHAAKRVGVPAEAIFRTVGALVPVDPDDGGLELHIDVPHEPPPEEPLDEEHSRGLLDEVPPTVDVSGRVGVTIPVHIGTLSATQVAADLGAAVGLDACGTGGFTATVDVVLGPDGRATFVGVTAPLLSATDQKCVESAITALHFSKSSGETTFRADLTVPP